MANKKVLLFLTQGFEDLEAISIIDICGWTEYREHIPTIEVIITGFHEEIRSRFGLVVRRHLPFDTVNPSEYDAFAIPGGFHSRGFDEAYDKRVYDLAKAIHSKGGLIVTMCVGVLPIAESGLLYGKKATTYPFSRNHNNPDFLKKFGCEYTGAQIEVSDRIISCSGPAQSIEVAILMLETLIGNEASKEVKKYMTYE